MSLRRFAALVLVAFSASTAWAQGGKSALNVDENSVMLHGFDAVAYHTQQAAVAGSPTITAVHEGAIYQFATSANRDQFKANPAKFAPAYGGYCAMGVAVDKKRDGDPKAFTIHNGTLYLNVDAKVKGMWSKDIPGNEKKAMKNWAGVSARKAFDKM